MEDVEVVDHRHAQLHGDGPVVDQAGELVGRLQQVEGKKHPLPLVVHQAQIGGEGVPAAVRVLLTDKRLGDGESQGLHIQGDGVVPARGAWRLQPGVVGQVGVLPALQLQAAEAGGKIVANGGGAIRACPRRQLDLGVRGADEAVARPLAVLIGVGE